jgi:hypothetical protein
MFLAIVNEDIMPSYTVLLAAMALAAVWFAQPSAARVLAVGGLFSLAWLMEWRLMFPTLPALVAALWLCEPRPLRRLAWMALLAAAMFGTAAAVALAWRGHDNAVGPFELMWTGKAVHSVWAGFSWAKVGYLWDGMVAYLLGTGVVRFTAIPGWDVWRVIATLWMLAVATVALAMLWRARREPAARAVAAVFGGTFLAGEVFNLYSQPQDPQMQLNVMAWLSVGWVFVLTAVRLRFGSKGLAAMAALTVALLGYNVWSLTPLRGLDGAWRAAMARLEQVADPSRTVWLVHDFDWTMVYGALHWGASEPGVDSLGPAPQALPKFKWIGLVGQVLRHPDWSDARLVADLRQQIDHALRLGYEVIAVRLWDMQQRELESATGMVADKARLDALRRVLHDDYMATLVFTDPIAGPLHRLQRKPAP